MRKLREIENAKISRKNENISRKIMRKFRKKKYVLWMDRHKLKKIASEIKFSSSNIYKSKGREIIYMT